MGAAPTIGSMSGLSRSLLIASIGCALATPATHAQSEQAPSEQAPSEQPQSEQTQQAPPPQEWWRGITFGTTLEGFYQFNFNEPADRVNVLRAYDSRANSFSLQQAAVVIDAAPNEDAGRRFGVRLDLQFGQATEAVQGGAANEPRPDVYRNVWQAYGSYVFPVGRGLQLDFGKFASNLGYETNYAKDNQAFSRAYLFNFLPYYHTGVRTSLPLSDKVTVLYMLTNGIQQTEDFNDFKSHQVSVVLKPTAAITATGNFFTGQEQPDAGQPDGPDGRFQVLDAYVTYTATPALTLGLDVNHTTNELNQADDALALTGVGAYARYQLTPAAAAGVRYERLDDEGLFGGIDQVLHEVTLTAEYEFADGFLVRGEFRRDWSNERFFPAPTAATPRAHQNTVLAGLVWWIGNKQGAW
jgi:hypothetical protein